MKSHSNLNFSSTLCSWYLKNKRDLPWRSSKNPYNVWLSEIILQQTRVEQGMPYYFRFIELFPTVYDLAKAPEETVLRAWQGLGYYSRARNLRKCAQMVVEKFHGEFPGNYQSLLSLPGIGPYTAAAIASICFGQQKAVVDGNVIRVITRLFAIDEDATTGTTQKIIQERADSLLENETPGNHNQAMMELGSLICKPKNPDCPNCPVSDYCESKLDGKAESRPLKLKKTKVKDRVINYFAYIDSNDMLLVKKRTNKKDIWFGMYDFPEEAVDKTNVVAEPHLLEGKEMVQFQLKDHKLSHQTIKTNLWLIACKEVPLSNDYSRVSLKDFLELPKPKLISDCLALINDQMHK
ncbi:A/G-specific adenine glycosylase [Luteibaculum oceani]|uniref:Adenine DNA glycosylase n=1 Tax=Luteibaculum oceani TaxID=1294296 RepID=A0A5C6VAE2_9FLAO|nr:A/G-specific adenine glycosylase [Luteibaculum oceani]TXC81810.1 A/G-specific adenine glycosylase [Luteibaculum oceani]